jgi:hypothetical protein
LAGLHEQSSSFYRATLNDGEFVDAAGAVNAQLDLNVTFCPTLLCFAQPWLWPNSEVHGRKRTVKACMSSKELVSSHLVAVVADPFGCQLSDPDVSSSVLRRRNRLMRCPPSAILLVG